MLLIRPSSYILSHGAIAVKYGPSSVLVISIVTVAFPRLKSIAFIPRPETPIDISFE